MMSVQIELNRQMLEVKPTRPAYGLIVSIDGATKKNPQAFVEQLVVWLCSHSNGNSQCEQQFLLVYYEALLVSHF